jgi:hypothetical protein
MDNLLYLSIYLPCPADIAVTPIVGLSLNLFG